MSRPQVEQVAYRYCVNVAHLLYRYHPTTEEMPLHKKAFFTCLLLGGKLHFKPPGQRPIEVGDEEWFLGYKPDVQDVPVRIDNFSRELSVDTIVTSLSTNPLDAWIPYVLVLNGMLMPLSYFWFNIVVTERTPVAKRKAHPPRRYSPYPNVRSSTQSQPAQEDKQVQVRDPTNKGEDVLTVTPSNTPQAKATTNKSTEASLLLSGNTKMPRGDADDNTSALVAKALDKSNNAEFLRNVPSFDGEKSFTNFIKKFNRLKSAYNVDDADAYMLFPSKLEGRAEKAFEALRPGQDHRDLTSLLTAMKEQLATPASQQTAKVKLSQPKRPAESFIAFADRLTDLYQRAYPKMDTASRDTLVIDSFINGLPAKIKNKLLRPKEPYTTLEKAREDAEAEAVLLEQETSTLNEKIDALTAAVNALQTGFSNIQQGRQQASNNNQGQSNGRRFFKRGNAPPVPHQSNGQANFNNNRGRGRKQQHQNRAFYPRQPPAQGFPYYPPYPHYPFQYAPPPQQYQDQQYPAQPPAVPYYQQQGQSKKPLTNFATTFTICMALVAIMMVPTTSAASTHDKPTFYQCERKRPTAILALPLPVICDNKPLGAFVETRVRLYTKQNNQKQYSAYTCSRIVTNICIKGYLRLFGLTLNMTQNSQTTLSTQECKDVIKDLQDNQQKYRFNGANVWTTQETKIPPLPFFGTNCVQQDTLVVERGAVSLLTGEQIISTFGVMPETCALSTGHCNRANSTTLWNVTQRFPTCSHKLLGQFKAILTEEQLLFPELQTSLQEVRNKALTTPNCIGEGGVVTNDNFVVHFIHAPRSRTIREAFQELHRRYKRSAVILQTTPQVFDYHPPAEFIMSELLSGRPSFSPDPTKDPELLRAMRERGVHWYDPLVQMSHYYDVNYEMAILRAIRLRDIRATVKKRLYAMTDVHVRDILRKELRIYDQDVLSLLPPYHNNPLEIIHGYRSVANILLVADGHHFDRALAREFPPTDPVTDYRVQDEMEREALWSTFAKELKSLNSYNYDIERREQEGINETTQKAQKLEKPYKNSFRIGEWQLFVNDLAYGALPQVLKDMINKAPPVIILTTTTAPWRTTTYTTPSTTRLTSASTNSSTTVTTSKVTPKWTSTTTTAITTTKQITPAPTSMTTVVTSTTSQTTPTTTTAFPPVTQALLTTRKTTAATTLTTTSPQPNPVLTSPTQERVRTTRSLEKERLDAYVRRMSEMEKQIAEYRYNTTLTPLVNYDYLESQICLIQQQRWDTIRSTVQMDPSIGARIFLQRNDVTAERISDNLLAIFLCREVIANQIFWNHKANGKCYDRLPIETDGEVKFVRPGTREIMHITREITCETVIPETLTELSPLQSAQENWRDSVNKAVLTKVVWKREFLPVIPALFAITSFQEKISDNSPMSKLKHVAQKGLEKFNEVTATGMGVITNLRDATSEIFENAKNKVIKTLLWILIPLVIVAITIPIMVFGGKYFLAAKLTTVATGQVIDTAIKMSPRIAQKALSKINSVRFKEEHELQTMTHTDDSEEEEIAEEQEKYRRQQEGKLRLLKAQAFTFVPLVCLIAPVHAVTPSSLPLIAIHIDSFRATALLDSGASLSYLRNSIFVQLNIPVAIQKPTLFATAANGTVIDFLAQATIPVTIGNVTVPHVFLISKDEFCPAEVLLGVDFIKALNHAGHPVQFNEGKVDIGNMSHVYSVFPDTLDVTVKEDVTIEPRTDNVIMGKFASLFLPDKTYLVEEHPKQPYVETLLIGRTLVQPKHQSDVPIRVLNPSAAPLIIYKGSRIATARLTPNHNVFSAQVNSYVPPEARWEDNIPNMNNTQAQDKDITSNIDLTNCVLSPDLQLELRRLLNHHRRAFVGENGMVGCYTGPIRHRIDLIDNAKVPAQRPYRVPLEQREEISRQIDYLLQNQIIQPSKSLFASPIVLVKKADGKSWRFAIDYRKLNAITRKATYLLPNIVDIMDLTAGKAIYTTLDFQHGFFQIPMEPEHTERTAFSCFMGSFEFLRLPMGLSGAPATFQHVMEEMRRHLTAAVFVYIDDLIVSSTSPTQHLHDLDEVLTAITAIGMTIRLEKSQLARSEVKFLGHVISGAGVQPNPEKVKVINHFPRPQSAKAVKQFLGMVSYFRRYIRLFAKIAAPLYALSAQPKSFDWTDEHQQAFETLKRLLMTAPILAAPRLGRPFVIETDASGIAIAAVLLQEDEDGQLHPIAYESRTLNRHEKRYIGIELEALAVVFAVEKFRPYITGASTTVVTDSQPLTAALRTNQLTTRLQKYQMSLLEYDLEFVYRPGPRNVLCDTLSRYPPIVANANITLPTLDVIRAAQRTCQWISDTISYLNTGSPDDSKIARKARRYIVEEDILYLRRKHEDNVIVIPEEGSLKTTLMSYFHENALVGAHLATQKTLKKIQERYVWTGMIQDISRFIRTCPACQSRKLPPVDAQKEEMGRYDIAQSPFQRVHLDVIGPLPQTINGYRYILVAVDAFSKYIVASPLTDQKADTCAQQLVNDIITKHGVPEIIITDRGTNFMSEVYEKTCALLGINHITTAAFHHSGNGQVERTNRTIEEMLTPFVNSSLSDWDDHLHLVVMAYNSAPHATTGFTPFYLIHGREPRLPIDNTTQKRTPRYSFDSYAELLRERVEQAFHSTRQKLLAAQDVSKSAYDARHRTIEKDVQVGDRVMLRDETAHKLKKQYTGPFEVVDVSRPNATLMTPRGRLVVHLDRVKRFFDRRK